MNGYIFEKDKKEEINKPTAGLRPSGGGAAKGIARTIDESEFSERAEDFNRRNGDLGLYMDNAKKIYDDCSGQAIKICRACGWTKFCHPTNSELSEFYVITKKKNIESLIKEFKEVKYKSICIKCMKLEKQKSNVDGSAHKPKKAKKLKQPETVEEKDEGDKIARDSETAKDERINELEIENKKLRKMVKELTELLVKDD